MKILLIVYDNDSFIHWFPLGLGYIASALRNAGHDVSVYSQDRYHYPESHLTTYLDEHKFDVVGVSVIAGDPGPQYLLPAVFIFDEVFDFRSGQVQGAIIFSHTQRDAADPPLVRSKLSHSLRGVIEHGKTLTLLIFVFRTVHLPGT